MTRKVSINIEKKKGWKELRASRTLFSSIYAPVLWPLMLFFSLPYKCVLADYVKIHRCGDVNTHFHRLCLNLKKNLYYFMSSNHPDVSHKSTSKHHSSFLLKFLKSKYSKPKPKTSIKRRHPQANE
jgi:hypothetical protein